MRRTDEIGTLLNHTYDGQQVIEERDQTGAAVRQYVYGGGIDRPLRYDDVANGRAYHYHRTTLGSSFALTDIATSNVVERMLYDAYGNVQVAQVGGAPASGNPFLFTGRRLDPATGHYYYRARYLDTLLGRFLGRDPLGIWGDPANLGNAYAYCNNNPINRVDPSGKLEIHVTATYSGIASTAGGTPDGWMTPNPPTGFASTAGGSPNILMDPNPPTAGFGSTADGDPNILMDPNPPTGLFSTSAAGTEFTRPPRQAMQSLSNIMNAFASGRFEDKMGSEEMYARGAHSLVLNLSLGWQSRAAATEFASCHGALVLAASGIVTDNKHPDGHYRSMDWASPLLAAISIWDYERNFSEVSGLGAEAHLSGNDSEWRFAGPSGTGKTFAARPGQGVQECTISK